MSILQFALGTRRWFPGATMPRIEAGTKNVNEYARGLHAVAVRRWFLALQDGPLTRGQLQKKLGRAGVSSSLFKMRHLSFIIEAGEVRHPVTNNRTKLWAWAGEKEMATKDYLKNASRAQLIAYLESWGFQCYPHETTGALRKAALENFTVEKS